jgi:hypothetical protein
MKERNINFEVYILSSGTGIFIIYAKNLLYIYFNRYKSSNSFPSPAVNSSENNKYFYNFIRYNL